MNYIKSNNTLECKYLADNYFRINKDDYFCVPESLGECDCYNIYGKVVCICFIESHMNISWALQNLQADKVENKIIANYIINDRVPADQT